MIPRRRLLAAGLMGLAQLPLRLFSDDGPEPLFVEVSPSKSGIRWVHENAMSENRYLPETVGAGCAFVDYDNDGWMDLYFVNSGPCDFFKPRKPPRNALYKNNRDGTFTDVTEDAGRAGRHVRHGCGPWAITTTTASPICSSRPTAVVFSTTTTATAPSPT